MKQIFFQYTNRITRTALAVAVLSMMSVACDDDDPQKEDTPEMITKATLTFTPEGGGDVVTVTATDPDGEGTQDISVDGPIVLAVNKTYKLELSLINELAEPSDPAYDVTEEVEEEGDEHMFFFGWTNNVFSDPSGNGNIDNRDDEVNYTGAANSVDENNLPLGLTTTWTTPANAATGTFTILLKHQPDLKSETSDADTGETDLDLTFDIEVE